MPRIEKMTVKGHMGRDWSHEFGRMNLIIGPTGNDKTAIITALEILQYGTHTSGERQYAKPHFALAAAGRGNGGARYEGIFADPDFTVSRDLFWDKAGKLDHSARCSLSGGSLTAVQKAINEAVGADPMHFDVGAFARLPDEKLRTLLLAALKNAKRDGDIVDRAAVADLSSSAAAVGVTVAELDEAFDWLTAIREKVRAQRVTKQNRKNEIGSALRELSGGAITANPAQVKAKRDEKAKLEDEKSGYDKQLGEMDSLEEQRENYQKEIDRLTEKLGTCQEASDALPGLKQQHATTIKERDAAARLLEKAVDAVSVAKKSEETTSAAVSELDSEVLTLKAEIEQAEAKVRHFVGITCPKCDADISDLLKGQTEARIEMLQKEVAALAEQRPALMEEVGKASDNRLGAAEAASTANTTLENLNKLASDQADSIGDATEVAADLDSVKETLSQLKKKLAQVSATAERETVESLRTAVVDRLAELQTEITAADKAMARIESKAKLDEENIRIKGELDEIGNVLKVADMLRGKATVELLKPIADIMGPFLGALGSLAVQTEDEKGSPCFRLGLERDDVFRKLDMLSRGERTVALHSLALALDICRGVEQPVAIFDSIECLHRTLREETLQNIFRLVDNDKIGQAFVTWNVELAEVPAAILDALAPSDYRLIDLNP